MEQLKYEILDNLNDYTGKKTTYDSILCDHPLFHGTTLFAIEASAEVVSAFCNHCKIVLRKAKKYTLSLNNREAFYESAEHYCQKSKIAPFWHFIERFEELEDYGYQYGDFYVTTNYLLALEYSKNAGGELGNLAHNAELLLEDLGIDLDLQESISVLKKNYPLFSESERVILIADKIPFDDLKYERGYTLNKDYIDYLYETDFNTNLSFRLLHPEKYQLKLIRKPLFKEGISCFTDIKDVDSFLRTST
ncbi:MAG: hypothetical protein J5584_07290 [Clostridia bacterium]|nr:hypothetical protein [Clostridia bacterium]